MLKNLIIGETAVEFLTRSRNQEVLFYIRSGFVTRCFLQGKKAETKITAVEKKYTNV
jgi:hypothetical protein